jgi:hypothetical protein
MLIGLLLGMILLDCCWDSTGIFVQDCGCDSVLSGLMSVGKEGVENTI